jgi:D-lyxose ketol-isomerase
MKRSSINRYICEARAFFAENRFVLPPFADWTPETWQQRGVEANELRTQRLGWDVTDFNAGHFDTLGLTLFTLRNGSSTASNLAKPYAETEDIINRGGRGTGHLVVKLYNASEDGGLANSIVSVNCDGIPRQVEPGGIVILGAGESITLPPYVYHAFHATDGNGLIGEVSSLNDDAGDNYFHEPLPRYSQILEDEPAFRLLCTEYGNTR